MAGYIGSKASVVSSGAERKKIFTITGATTSLTGFNYTVGKVHVFQNGVRLVDGTDYTATNGTTITLAVAAQSGDNVVAISQAGFQVADIPSGTPSIDDNGNATALTIDSDENVLIGKSSASFSTAGQEFRANGGATVLGRSGAEPLTLNRISSDGDILSFRKDNTAVGKIGVVSDDRMYFATADGLGLQFDKDNNRIIPCDATGGYNSNVELGDEGLAFTNLFLTGGIQFDSRSSKLEDYEEGTFTVGVTQGTIGGGDGVYVKVGDLVFCSFTAGDFSNTSSGNAIEFTGLPFTSNNVNYGSHGSVFCRYTNKFPDAIQVSSGAAQCRMWKSNSTAYETVNYNNLTNGGYAYFFVNVTYRAA